MKLHKSTKVSSTHIFAHGHELSEGCLALPVVDEVIPEIALGQVLNDHQERGALGANAKHLRENVIDWHFCDQRNV